MSKTSKIIAASALLAVFGAVFAQGVPSSIQSNVLQLTAAASAEAVQDLLVLTLSTTREGKDASTVQAQLQQLLDSALQEARRQAQPGQLDVRTGAFGLFPRYSQAGQITGWQGRAELVLQGRDFARITATAAKVQGLTISQVEFGLSPEARSRAEGQAQAQAIAQFQQRAQELARQFGFSAYTLREVQVHSSDSGPGPRPRVFAMEARAMAMPDAAPVPVEAGKAQVEVRVSGSVQMR